MAVNYQVRYANHPDDARQYDTERIRKEYLVQNLMTKDTINMVYSMIDRYIVGGVIPQDKELKLETIDPLKSDNFLDRREMGIINVGGKGIVRADGEQYELKTTDALYLGRGTKDVVFVSDNSNQPAHFYFNSALAHKAYPATKVTMDMADVTELGSQDNANIRVLNKMIAGGIVETCQLQMGITVVKQGNVWNTMPVHLHERRMEAYFYFDVPEEQAVCHFMGQPKETRHIFMHNEEAVISPAWSIHAAAGTANYKFIWGMAGENMEFGDMDGFGPKDLK